MKLIALSSLRAAWAETYHRLGALGTDAPRRHDPVRSAMPIQPEHRSILAVDVEGFGRLDRADLG